MEIQVSVSSWYPSRKIETSKSNQKLKINKTKGCKPSQEYNFITLHRFKVKVIKKYILTLDFEEKIINI